MKSLKILSVVAALAACHPNSGLEMETVNARPMAAGSGVSPGDCVEARKRAGANPELDVDRLPAPVKQSPVPFQKMPASVRNQVATKGAVVKVDVIVDTIGRADMTTFKILEASNPWLAASVKSVLPRWRFSPAELAGCKVRRVYKFSATSPKRG